MIFEFNGHSSIITTSSNNYTSIKYGSFQQIQNDTNKTPSNEEWIEINKKERK